MELTLTSKHELLGSGYFIGVDNENISEQLIINIEPEELLNKWAYIEFQVNEGNKYNTPRIDIVDRQIIYDLPNGLLEKGYVKIQVIFRDDTNFLWKSFEKKFHVSDAINACQNLPEEYPDFITEAQKLLDEVSIDAAKIDEVIETEAARVEAENTRVENENTRIANENNRSNAEQTRSTAEAERISNEETRQSNEVARVNAESQRETKFNTWEGTLGVLDNLSNALKNTASGEVIRVDDVSPVEHNVKVKVQGKNLIPLPYKQYADGTNGEVRKGITVVCENGVIILNGTATEDMGIQLIDKQQIRVKGKYTLSGIANGTEKTYYMQPYINGEYQGPCSMQPVVYEWDGILTRLVLYIKAGTVVENVEIRPQLEEGDTATEYEPYVDPTSVTVTRCGKNLADLSKAVKDDVFVDNGNGTYTLTKQGQSGQRFSNSIPMFIKSGSSITFTFDIVESTTTQHEVTEISAALIHNDGTESAIIVKNGLIRNITKDISQMRFFIHANESDGTYITLKNFQVEIGNTGSDYEAYKATETYTPNADGTLTIASTAPTMTLLTDKDVNIEAEYNQDINKVIKSLQDKINALTK